MSFDAPAREQFLEHLRSGMRPGAAAFVGKIPRATVDGYMAEHPDFALEVRDAEATATEHVEEAVYQAAISGNVQAARLWFAVRGRGVRRPAGRAPEAGGGDTGPEGDEDDLGAAMESIEGQP